jgi:hypothetical protein
VSLMMVPIVIGVAFIVFRKPLAMRSARWDKHLGRFGGVTERQYAMGWIAAGVAFIVWGVVIH